MRLRLLFLTPSVPYPPIGGFQIRVYQLIQHLSQYHRISLLTYRDNEGQDQQAIAAMKNIGVEVHAVPRSFPTHFRKRLDQIHSLMSFSSYQMRSLYSASMQQAIDRILSKERFDIIHVESSQMAVFDFGHHAPVVIDEHDIVYELLDRICRGERSLVRKLYGWIEYAKLRREEQRCWERVAGCVLTSAREETILHQHVPGKPTAVVPNGVDLNYFSPEDGVHTTGSIVLTGLMKTRPNADGAIFFVREILPLILRVRPDVTLTIVGADPPSEVRSLAGPNVIVTGSVPDVRPYVARAAVSIVPLRMGSGTRLKILEGLAMGKAIVSTSLGCEGIAVNHGEHLLIADEVVEFASAILRLLKDPSLAGRLGRSGQALAVSTYSWGSSAPRLEHLYAQLLNSREPCHSGSRNYIRRNKIPVAH